MEGCKIGNVNLLRNEAVPTTPPYPAKSGGGGLAVHDAANSPIYLHAYLYIRYLSFLLTSDLTLRGSARCAVVVFARRNTR